jgi:hypothetical protein
VSSEPALHQQGVKRTVLGCILLLALSDRKQTWDGLFPGLVRRFGMMAAVRLIAGYNGGALCVNLSLLSSTRFSHGKKQEVDLGLKIGFTFVKTYRKIQHKLYLEML